MKVEEMAKQRLHPETAEASSEVQGGMVMRPSVEIKLSAEERNELERLARGRKVWRGLSDRAHIVLLATEGLTNVQIGSVLGVTNQTARK